MTSGPDAAADLTIRPPLQARSRHAWARVLDAGVAILCKHGYEGFTIASVCARAKVAPRAVYDRAASKDALFLAVYEHGMSQVRADEAAFGDAAHWRGLEPVDLVAAAVRQLIVIFEGHADFLRAVLVISGVHPEVQRRGGAYGRELGDQFVAVLRGLGSNIAHSPAEVDTVLRSCFMTVFSAVVMRISYGPGFAVDPVDDATFGRHLVAMSTAYLLGGTTR